MSEFAKQAFACRKRAEQLRSLAQALSSGKAKQQLLDLAMDYDRLAEMRDALSAAQPPKGPV